MAWVAWKDSCYSDVVDLADEALELWGGSGFTFSQPTPPIHKGPCLWPPASVRLDAAGRPLRRLMPGALLLSLLLVCPLDQAESLLRRRPTNMGRWRLVRSSEQTVQGFGDKASALGHCWRDLAPRDDHWPQSPAGWGRQSALEEPQRRHSSPLLAGYSRPEPALRRRPSSTRRRGVGGTDRGPPPRPPRTPPVTAGCRRP